MFIDIRQLNTKLRTTASAPPPSLPSLPTELQLEIFKHLDPVSSTCLGVTCKTFYFMHKKRYRKNIRLNRRWFAYRDGETGKGYGKFHYLGALLEKWAGPTLVYRDWGSAKFVKREDEVVRLLGKMVLD